MSAGPPTSEIARMIAQIVDHYIATYGWTPEYAHEVLRDQLFGEHEPIVRTG